jgi:hypothetical protein
MQSFHLSSQINQHGLLQIQLPKELANQEVDFVLVIQQKNSPNLTLTKAFSEIVKIPNAVTCAAMQEAESGTMPHFETVKELFDDLEKDSAE